MCWDMECASCLGWDVVACWLQVQEAVKQYNIQGVHPRLHAYLNQAVWLHMEGMVAQACKMASQRADLSR